MTACVVEGLATPFNVPMDDPRTNYAGLRPYFEPGAFARLLNDLPVALDVNHQGASGLPTTKDGKHGIFVVDERADGLHFSATITNDIWSQTLLMCAAKGGILGCSITWSSRGEVGEPRPAFGLHAIREARVLAISLCLGRSPAFSGTFARVAQYTLPSPRPASRPSRPPAPGKGIPANRRAAALCDICELLPAKHPASRGRHVCGDCHRDMTEIGARLRARDIRRAAVIVPTVAAHEPWAIAPLRRTPVLSNPCGICDEAEARHPADARGRRLCDGCYTELAAVGERLRLRYSNRPQVHA